MEQKRMFLAIAISIAILLVFQLLSARFLPQPAPVNTPAGISAPQEHPAAPAGAHIGPAPGIGAEKAAEEAEKPSPRLAIHAPAVSGSIDLRGARLDDLLLNNYRESVEPGSPLVRLLTPESQPKPYWVQFGWSAPPGANVKLPSGETVWAASAPQLSPSSPVTLSWDNGQGLEFQIALAIDDHYMLTIEQRVKNNSGASVSLFPWMRIRRDYTPQTAGYYILHEGLLGVLDDRLKEVTYANARSEGAKHEGLAFTSTGAGGWAGITDKYWLVALIPDQTQIMTASFRNVKLPNGDGYQVDFVSAAPQTISSGASVRLTERVFAGAKVVSLLDHYEQAYGIPHFDKAVDFGWFYFLTKPIFYALDWLYKLTGNFGVAILIFTVFVKALFFPLANKSYRSMSKMRLLGPKMQAIRERFKDDPARQQQEMMNLYRAEGVNPASGCLPMLIQVPVFFSLYKVIFVTIEMRQAPFFGWIRDLSAPDPTNIFNLFGLLPFDPTQISSFLQLGIWPIIMGFSMYLQQRLNPPPPDPVQARLFQFMPVIFTFMLARFPAGLVIYWTWNNLLSIVQQWLIMRNTRLSQPRMART
ncbi:MAG: membrane protein insertase YidC [Acetobacteraceae bacterium]|nr:membrane protein insertase YidC [Acetobacteraceae bacterium]